MLASRFTRRAVLLATAAAPTGARAFGEASRFVPALAKHGGTFDTRVSGLRRLAFELQRRTSVEAVLETRVLALDSPRLFEHPWVYLSSETEVPPLSAAEVEGLRRYLTFGGLVFAEAADGNPQGPAATSLRRELKRVLPQSPLGELPRKHVLFKSFFLLENPAGRVLAQSSFDGALVNRRAAVIFTANDVMGALCRDETGSWLSECVPGGERQRELAIRTAINVVMYALCLDYKDDAVHLEQILKRRR